MKKKKKFFLYFYSTLLLDQLQLVQSGGDSGPRRDQHGTQIFCHLHLGPMSSASRAKQGIKKVSPYMLLQIGAFRLFRKWKAFSVWRKNVLTKKVANCKKALNENLFIVNPVSIFFQEISTNSTVLRGRAPDLVVSCPTITKKNLFPPINCFQRF
jgi:hypothetical protein